MSKGLLKQGPVYKARDGYRWRCVADNGRIVAVSAEAFASKSNAERAFETAAKMMTYRRFAPRGRRR